MACSYDTQTVLEMLFDINTDNGINNDRIRATQIAIVVVIVARSKYVHLSIYVGPLSIKCLRDPPPISSHLMFVGLRFSSTAQ